MDLQRQWIPNKCMEKVGHQQYASGGHLKASSNAGADDHTEAREKLTYKGTLDFDEFERKWYWW